MGQLFELNRNVLLYKLKIQCTHVVVRLLPFTTELNSYKIEIHYNISVRKHKTKLGYRKYNLKTF